MDEPGADLLSELLLQTEAERDGERAAFRDIATKLDSILTALQARASNPLATPVAEKNTELDELLSEMRSIRSALSIKGGRKGKINFTVLERDDQERISQAEIAIK